DVTLKMPAFEWVHVQLHQQKGMISLSPPTICNSAVSRRVVRRGRIGDPMSVDRTSRNEANIRMMALLQDPPGRRCRDRLQDEARITQDRVMDTSRMENESRSG
ncbi:hypothetical protein EJ779_27895, partial [Klebsiella pneumoniae subsp. pneumoniae]